MANENSVIYGLEFPARALTSQLGETEKIRFLIGTQSLKQANNQIHLVEFNEEISTVKTTVFYHSEGEIWRITTSPLDPQLLATCYNSVVADNGCVFKTALLKLPEEISEDDIENLEISTKFDTTPYGEEVKTTEFHPGDLNKAASVVDNHIIIWDINENLSIRSYNLEGKHQPKFTIGKWNPHHNSNQFTTATENHLKTYDIRSDDVVWQIDSAHTQLIRDIDFNMNKQYHLATCSDDGFVKIWDSRQSTKPVYSHSHHNHWVWCVRFNHFHDQLLLSASSDAKVLLASAASVSSEDISDETGKVKLPDGAVQWCEHEDSVYCAEWSPSDPWIFASLSYDGRLVISRVKKSLKYQIML